VGLMFGLSVMSYFDRTIVSIAGPAIIKEFHLTETQMGAVYSAFLCSYALLMMPAGSLADRFGPSRVLARMAVGSGLSTMLTGAGAHPFLTSWLGVVVALALMRLMLGIFTAPLYPGCARMNANWVPVERRARVQALINSGAGLGGAAAPYIFTRLIEYAGWRTAFSIAGLATMLLGVFWIMVSRDYPSSPARPAQGIPVVKTPWRKLLTNRNVVLLTLGFAALNYFEYIFFYWIYYYFSEVRKFRASAAIFTTVLFLTWFIMTPIGGWITDRGVLRYGVRQGLRVLSATSLILSAILLFAGAYSDRTGVVVILMSLALGFAAWSDVTFWAAMIGIGGEHVGAACGIMNSAGNLGGFLAPLLTPWIAARAGWAGGLCFGSAVALVGVFTWFFIDAEQPVENVAPSTTVL
jgi:sugar phosphate permease